MAVRMVDPRKANTPFYVGESSDTKPTVTAPSAGSRFYETDTGRWFIQTGVTGDDWVEMHQPEAGIFDKLAGTGQSSTDLLLEDILEELRAIRRLLEEVVD